LPGTGVDVSTTFEEIVQDVEPEAHWVCHICYPPPVIEAGDAWSVCGVKLVGLPARPGMEMCDSCTDELIELHWSTHTYDEQADAVRAFFERGGKS
jgi:hypothetical protein